MDDSILCNSLALLDVSEVAFRSALCIYHVLDAFVNFQFPGISTKVSKDVDE